MRDKRAWLPAGRASGMWGAALRGRRPTRRGSVDDLDLAVGDGEAVPPIEVEGAGMVVGTGVQDHAAGPVAPGGGDRMGEQQAAEPGADAGRDHAQIAQRDIRRGPPVEFGEADRLSGGLRQVDFALRRRDVGRERGLVHRQAAPPEPVVADRMVEAQIVGSRHGPAAADGDAGHRGGWAHPRGRRLHRQMGHHRAELAGRNARLRARAHGPGTGDRGPDAQRPQEMPSSSSMSEPWAARPSSEQRKSAAEAMSSASE